MSGKIKIARILPLVVSRTSHLGSESVGLLVRVVAVLTSDCTTDFIALRNTTQKPIDESNVVTLEFFFLFKACFSERRQDVLVGIAKPSYIHPDSPNLTLLYFAV